MLTIVGPTARTSRGKFCDGMSRRDALRVGAFSFAGLFGMSLPQLLRAEAQAGIGRSHKAIINVLLPGGPPHQDMVDLKPDAPSEVRGEFKPIKTNVDGIEISELMPRIAKMMDKFVLIRSLADSQGDHDVHQCVTGYKRGAMGPAGGIASIGAWVSRLAGTVTPAVPANLSLVYETGERRWGDPGGGGFLGRQHGPFKLVSGKNDRSSSTAQEMVLKDLSLDRLRDRNRLRAEIDRFRREADTTGSMVAMDQFHEQALGILTSSRLAEALDLSKEDPKVIERYGKPDPEYVADGAPRVTTNFLLARRLVEAGARYVTLNFSRWDWHGKNFASARSNVPMLDQALSALVGEIHERGLDKDVSVVCWGEFGRTPKINKDAGRDHWPKANFALLAGGGMRTGQVIGSTDKDAAEPKDRPVKFHEVFATLLHNMGLHDHPERLFDLQGRPHTPLEPGTQPLREVV